MIFNGRRDLGGTSPARDALLQHIYSALLGPASQKATAIVADVENDLVIVPMSVQHERRWP
jgi:hypothetical protein